MEVKQEWINMDAKSGRAEDSELVLRVSIIDSHGGGVLRGFVEKINSGLWDFYIFEKERQDCSTFPTCPHLLDLVPSENLLGDNPTNVRREAHATYLVPREHAQVVQDIIRILTQPPETSNPPISLYF